MQKKVLLLLVVSSLLSFFVSAQVSKWFTPVNFGLLPSATSGRYDDVFFISHDTGVLVSSYGIIFKTYDGAANWQVKHAVGPVYFRSLEFSSDGQVGIAGTLSGTVYRSADRGETWNDISVNISDTGADAKRICGLAHWNSVFYGVGWWGGNVARLYRSWDGGLTWGTTYLDTNLATGLVDATFLSATKGFITGYRRYAGGSKRESVVLRTLDGGDTWTKVFSDTTIGGGIWKIQFVDSQYGVGSIEPMYKDTVAMIKSTDGGNTWQIHSAGHVNAWASGWGTQGVGFLNRQKGWLGGYYNGMFETNDGGLTWDTLAVGQECDRFFLIDSTIYVSANTVYKYGDSAQATGVTEAPSFLHKLQAVTPNPANNKVQISFDIVRHKTNVVLDIVNIDSRKNYRILNGYLDAGHYEYMWDGTNAPAGNYIVWLGTDEIPMVRKFVLLHQ